MFNLPPSARPFSNAYVVHVTPDLARLWLSQNRFNRAQRPDLVADYVRQIKEGRWQRTHQGIAFSEKGTLLDGQHRLFAIAESGMTVPILVFVNEPLENHQAVDGGKRRTALDVVRLEIRSNSIKAKHIQTVKAMYAGCYCKSQNHLSSQEIVELLRRHFRAVDWTVEMFEKSKEIGTPTVMGVIARAYHSVPTERLLEFCCLLLSGEGDHPSVALIRDLREFIGKQRDRQEDTRRAVYRRVQYVLEAFLKGESTCASLKTLPPYNKELFLLGI